MLERLTAVLWVTVATIGLLIRTRRLILLGGLSYDDPDDQAYLHAVRRSSVLRWFVKLILLIGGTLAFWANPIAPSGDIGVMFWLWRGGIVIALILLAAEDVNVDLIRRRLGTPAMRRLP